MENENHQPEISVRKLEANRANALKSTGPKTVQGKNNSRQNALKHGLLSKELVLRGGKEEESAEEFQQLFEELIEDLQPQGRAELLLVETIAICDWRYRRTLRAEAEEIRNGSLEDPMSPLLPVQASRSIPGSDAVNKILRYQTTIHRQKMQALQLLEKLQQRRKISPTSANRESDAEKR